MSKLAIMLWEEDAKVKIEVLSFFVNLSEYAGDLQ